jgi:hypothetical protein
MEENDSKDQENTMWNSVLGFLSMELFGAEVTKAIEHHNFKGFPKKDEETVIDVELEDWEKKLFIITDAAIDYLRNHEEDLPVYQAKSFLRVANALREVFWSNLSLRHKEVRNKDYGIREGLKVVELPQNHEHIGNPLEEIIKMFPFPPPRKY